MTGSKALLALAAAGTVLTGHALNRSHALWATINMCNPKDKPFMIGIRGSMPGDGRAQDVMYMRFALQYQDPATKGWKQAGKGGYSAFLRAGNAAAPARELGRSFQLAIAPGKPATTLRGVVTFQWRKGTHVLYSTYRVTTQGHRSAAGADPPGYSAATCAVS